MRRFPGRVLALAFALAATVPAESSARVLVTTCGQVVQGQGVLAGDLDCSTHPGHAVVLDGTLVLNGFAVIGNATDPAGYSAVDCTGKCRVKIKGPGHIIGGSTGVSGSKVVVTEEVTVLNAAEWGIRGARVTVKSAFVHDNGAGLGTGPDGGGGIGGGKITVTRSTIVGNAAYGVDANVVTRLTHADLTGHAVADVRSFEEPKLHDTICFVSRRASLAESWNVCFFE